MLPFEDRYTRQRQLREVGLAGQQRLQASFAVLGATRGELVAADYLRRAGVSVQSLDPQAERATPHVREQSRDDQPGDHHVAPLPAASYEPFCVFEGPSEYLRGSLTALHHLRQTLGVGEPSGLASDEPALNQSK